MIKYFVQKDFKTTVYTFESTFTYDERELYINRLLKINLIDLTSYKRLIRYNLEIKSRIPLFLNAYTILFKIKTQNSIIYLNYLSIINIGVSKDNVFILFRDGSYLEICYMKNTIRKDLEKCRIIMQYKETIKNKYI